MARPPGVCVVLAMCYFLFVLRIFDGADAYAVPRFLGEHVADAFAFSNDAVSVDFVLINESVLNGFSAVFSEFDVEVEVTVLRSIAFNEDFRIFVILEVSGDHFNVGLLVGGDNGRTDAEEYVANRVEVVANFLDGLYGTSVAGSELVGEVVCFGFSGVGLGSSLVESGAEVVNLTVEGVDFSLVVRHYASEFVATEVVGNRCLEVECSTVDVISGGCLVGTGVVHVPCNVGAETQSYIVAYVEVEVETGFGNEVVGIAMAYNIVVTPAGTGNSLNGEGAGLAVVAAEEVEQVNCSVCSYVRIVESGK